MRALAQSSGAQYIQGSVEQITRKAAVSTPSDGSSSDSAASECVDGVVLSDGRVLRSTFVVNCAGAYAGAVSAAAGVTSAVQPQRQHLFRVALPAPLPYRFPMVRTLFASVVLRVCVCSAHVSFDLCFW